MTNTTPRRRSSRSVHVTLLTAAALLPVAAGLSGCEDPVLDANTNDTAVVYNFDSAKSCAESEIFTVSQCAELETTAQAKYDATAWKYQSQDDCLTDSDACVPAGQTASSTQSSTTASSGGSSGHSNYVFVNSGSGGGGGGGYSPAYKGYSVGLPPPGSSEPLAAHPIISGKGQLATPNGIGGLHFNEAMTVPRSSLAQSAQRAFFSAGQSITSLTRAGAIPAEVYASAGRPAAVSARGGFGSSISAAHLTSFGS